MQFFEFTEKLGGNKEFYEWIVIIVYTFYISYFSEKYLCLNAVLGDDEFYPNDYKIWDQFEKIKRSAWCCSKRKRNKGKGV